MLLRFPTLNFGMTLKDSENNRVPQKSLYNNLRIYETNDGSITLENTDLKESFHNSAGAKKEAFEKFINPSEINLYNKEKEICVLDICVGMGYNSACLLETTIENRLSLNWWGLEQDRMPLKIALSNTKFSSSWDSKILEILELINQQSKWENKYGVGKILWGDARRKINEIPEGISFDLIFHDAFSPQRCPELWSEEFLQHLSKKLSKGGKLITYSRAAAVRASLRRSNLTLKSLITNSSSKNNWSNGTVAIKNAGELYKAPNTLFWTSLSKMEEEHLMTIAAVPYRDPSGNSSSIEIIRRRLQEQKDSTFLNTNKWKKRWILTKS